MKISKNIKDRLFDAIISAFVFAAALSWRDTLVVILKQVLPEGSNPIWSELIVTVGITALMIILVYALLKSSEEVDHRLGLDQDESDTK